jgi:hypothetical protein
MIQNKYFCTVYNVHVKTTLFQTYNRMFLGSKPHVISCNDHPQNTRAAPPSNIEALAAQQPLVSLPGSSFQGGSKFVNQTIKATIAQGPGLVERKIARKNMFDGTSNTHGKGSIYPYFPN